MESQGRPDAQNEKSKKRGPSKNKSNLPESRLPGMEAGIQNSQTFLLQGRLGYDSSIQLAKASDFRHS
jgi:hypothetical protein